LERPVVLTGIKPTGSIHVGNYLGAIRPALQFLKPGSPFEHHQAYYFIADYHALTSVIKPALLKQWTLEVAATWMALGLDSHDHESIVFYRQSDIPELFELTWILNCVAHKGLMNRAHAYKAFVDSNVEKGADPDEGINIGLFTYPILMSSDILAFQTHWVPVGQDQLQHIEIARDLAQNLNHRYKKPLLHLPKAFVQQESKVIPGLDGRKMSKSYDNTIPLFASPTQLKKLISKIKTDSTPPGSPKQAEGSLIFSLYQEFASAQEIESFKKNLEEGLSWGDAKEQLFLTMNKYLEQPRQTYEELLSSPKKIEDVLQQGAITARKKASQVLNHVKSHILG
jgi:tryptophanyl-tRNA synthetase